MTLQRSKRDSKWVDYSALENAFSDDDFTDFTPPSKKKKKKKCEKREFDKENEAEDCLYTVETKNQISLREKSPKRRLSVEERKFQRELEMALDKSKEEFQGFNKDEETEELERFSPPKSLVITAEIHSTLSGDEAERKYVVREKLEKEIEGGAEERLRPYKEISVTSNGFTSKRQGKKVSFAEDDSDGWSNHEDEEKIFSCDTDESDFLPSPQKKKKKKKKAKESKRPITKLSKNKESNSKTVTQKEPLKLKQQVSSEVSLPVHAPEDIVSKGINENASPTGTSELIVRKASNKSISSSPKSTSLACDSKPVGVLGLVKKPFKSPVIGSSSSTLVLSPSASARTGLRLGLSRKMCIKPLHPNASMK